MEALKKTLFIIAVTSVIAYTIRHVYLKWVEPQTSILDKYDRPIINELKNATSLEQLAKLFDEVHLKVLASDSVDSLKVKPEYQKYNIEPYKTESEIREAINSWESKSKEIFELRFYWAIGFVLNIIGYLLYRNVSPWLGITFLITGFGEMVYWTSPSLFGSGLEYEKLLSNKLTLSILTLLFLIAAGFLTDTLKSSSKDDQNADH